MLPNQAAASVAPLHGRNSFSPIGVPSSATSIGKDMPSPVLAGAGSPMPDGIPGSLMRSVEDANFVDVIATANTSGGNTNNNNNNSVPGAQSFTITPLMNSRDRVCFRHFVMGAAAFAGLFLFAVWYVWHSTAAHSTDPKTGKLISYTFQYFMCCLLGGVVAGTVHLVVTPIDVVKCRVQVGEYRSFKDGFVHLFYAEAEGSVLRALPLFFRGWVPTAWGYCIQGALKFSLYEVFKYVLLIGPRERRARGVNAIIATTTAAGASSVYDSSVFHVLMFLLSSSLAEVIADVGLAPWEAVKIRMQTSHAFPTSLRAALPRMWETEGLHGFYKGLVPLWCRQVPYTMMKFSSFEMIVVQVTTLFDAVGLLDPSDPGVFGRLVVSLLAGTLAGVLCGLVSHPADTILSKLNQKSSVSGGVGATGAPLLASTIAAARTSSGMSGGNATASGTYHDITHLMKELGWRGVWKGLAPRLMMVSALTALQWVAYDGFKVLVGLPTSGGVPHK